MPNSFYQLTRYFENLLRTCNSYLFASNEGKHENQYAKRL
jgi:hypothetical protein